MTAAATEWGTEDTSRPDPGWRSADGRLSVRYVAPNQRAGAELTAQVAAAVADSGGRADLDLRGDTLGVCLDPHPPTTSVDQLAGVINRIAEACSARPEPTSPQEITIAVDALDRSAVQPFWAAALAYVRRDAEHLVDPVGRGPTIYFQQMDRARPQRNRVHVDVWVSRPEVGTRVDSALAAGGVLVTDEHAPGWWVLADHEGNEVCIATREP